MKHLLIIFSLLLTSVCWSKDVDLNDLVKRNGLFYEKLTNEPFTGKVVGFEADRTRDHQPYGTTYIHSNFGQMRVRGAYQRLVGKTVSVRLTSHLFFDSNNTLINEDG